jgi:hypothetical protein
MFFLIKHINYQDIYITCYYYLLINGAFTLDVKLMLNENLDGILGGT